MWRPEFLLARVAMAVRLWSIRRPHGWSDTGAGDDRCHHSNIRPPPKNVVVRLACGLILLGAVALKVQGMTAGGVGESLALFSPRVQLLGLEAEALVGVWLVSGYAHRIAWLAGVALFTLLAAVSIYLVAVGQKSCGCFGRVEVSPWVSLALDVTCVAALVAIRPTGFGQQFSPRGVLTVVGLLAVASGLAFVATGDVAGRQLARLRGESLILNGNDADAGTAPNGESRLVPVTIENVTGADLHLTGGTVSCACMATNDLPLTIPAGGKATAHVTIKFTGEAGRFKHTFQWYTDAPNQFRLSGSVAGRVDATAE